MNDKIWDVFISHASEDKDTVARPLARALWNGGVRVWIDEQELCLGDSLSGKIDHGLASSRFGVVIFSPAFFAKQWPKRELAGLRAIEEDGEKVILPVWHNVNKSLVAKHSPVLADLLAVSTSQGIMKVAGEIFNIVFSTNYISPSSKNPRLSRRFLNILKSSPVKEDLLGFLKSHPRQVSDLLRSAMPPTWDVSVCGIKFDAVVLSNLSTTIVPTLHYVSFLPIWDDPFQENHDGTIELQPMLVDMLDRTRLLRADYERNTEHRDFRTSIDQLTEGLARASHPSAQDFDNIAPLIEFTIFCGRRERVDADKLRSKLWRDSKAANHQCRLRTYDGIVDDFMERENGNVGWDFGSYTHPDNPA